MSIETVENIRSLLSICIDDKQYQQLPLDYRQEAAIEKHFLITYGCLSVNLLGRTIAFRIEHQSLFPANREDAIRIGIYKHLLNTPVSDTWPLLCQQLLLTTTVPVVQWLQNETSTPSGLFRLDPIASTSASSASASASTPAPASAPAATENANANVANSIVALFQARFAAYLRPSSQCRFPHISRPDLFQHLKAGNLDNIAVFEKFMQYNRYLGLQLGTNSQHQAAQLKQPADPLYLGSWRNFEWIDIALSPDPIATSLSVYASRSNSNSRSIVPTRLRQQVWYKNNKNVSDIGTCYVCDESLDYSNMECGHIIAHAIGGLTTLENLMPVCKMCNRNMGIMNLEKYREIVSDTLLHHQDRMNF